MAENTIDPRPVEQGSIAEAQSAFPWNSWSLKRPNQKLRQANLPMLKSLLRKLKTNHWKRSL